MQNPHTKWRINFAQDLVKRLETFEGIKAIVSSLNAEFLYAYDGPAHEDQLLIDGVQVDLWDVSTTHQEEILENVLHKYHFDLGTLNALDTIRSCIPLFGHEIVQQWKLRAQVYPDEVANSIIQE